MINDYVGVLAPVVYDFVSVADRNIIHIADLETQITASAFAPGLKTLLTLNTNHSYQIGDELLILNEYVIVDEIPAPNQIVVNTETGSYPATTPVFRVLKWTQPTTSVDLADTLLNRVPELIPSFSPTQSASSRYDFKVIRGEIFEKTEYNVIGVYNSLFGGGAATNKVQFLVTSQPGIGDVLSVDLSPFIWNYGDNNFQTGNLGFISTNPHYLMPGKTINVRGQITHPSYNGRTRVDSVINSTTIRTEKAWLGSTPTESGIITYDLRPKWNVRTTVIEVIQDSPNWLVTVDLDIEEDDPLFANSSLQIPVTGKLIDTRFNIVPNVEQSFLKSAYYSDRTDMVPTVNGVFSTILQSGSAPISKTGRTHLAIHLAPSLSWNFIPQFNYEFLDSNGNLLGTHTQVVVNNGNDYFIPVALTDLGISIPSGTKKYTIQSNTGVAPTNTQTLEFELTDCPEYDEYTIIWKDARGSYISFPFDLISSELYSSERDVYYTDLEKTYNVETWVNWALSTNWIKEEWNYLFKDMLQSTAHLLKKPNGDVIRVTLLTDQIEFGTRDKDGVIQYNVIVREAKKLKRR